MCSHYMQLTTWRLMSALLGFKNSDCSLDSVTSVKISLLDLGHSFRCVTPNKDEHKFLREHADNTHVDVHRMLSTRTILLAPDPL